MGAVRRMGDAWRFTAVQCAAAVRPISRRQAQAKPKIHRQPVALAYKYPESEPKRTLATLGDFPCSAAATAVGEEEGEEEKEGRKWPEKKPRSTATSS